MVQRPDLAPDVMTVRPSRIIPFLSCTHCLLTYRRQACLVFVCMKWADDHSRLLSNPIAPALCSKMLRMMAERR